MKKKKRRFGDRKDATLVRDIDPLHIIMPCMFPNRCDNESYLTETIDLTNINKYIEKQKMDNPESEMKLFHIICAALVKTLVLRPKMNRFVQGKRLFQKNDLSLSFVVKKQFNDKAQEGMVFMNFEDDNTLFDTNKRILNEVHVNRNSKSDSATDSLAMFSKLPHFVTVLVVKFLNWLDYHGWMPQSICDTDMGYSSVFISNLGSIKLNAAYHHLTNRGTNSIFVVIGEKKKMPFYDENGNVEMRETVQLGLTLDERIADGYYYSKTVKLMKYLLNNPEELEKPAKQEVDYDI